jgi:hypothetical protein
MNTARSAESRTDAAVAQPSASNPVGARTVTVTPDVSPTPVLGSTTCE